MGEEVFFNSHAVQQLQIRLERWSNWKKRCGNKWNRKGCKRIWTDDHYKARRLLYYVL